MSTRKRKPTVKGAGKKNRKIDSDEESVPESSTEDETKPDAAAILGAVFSAAQTSKDAEPPPSTKAETPPTKTEEETKESKMEDEEEEDLAAATVAEPATTTVVVPITANETIYAEIAVKMPDYFENVINQFLPEIYTIKKGHHAGEESIHIRRKTSSEFEGKVTMPMGAVVKAFLFPKADAYEPKPKKFKKSEKKDAGPPVHPELEARQSFFMRLDGTVDPKVLSFVNFVRALEKAIAHTIITRKLYTDWLEELQKEWIAENKKPVKPTETRIEWMVARFLTSKYKSPLAPAKNKSAAPVSEEDALESDDSGEIKDVFMCFPGTPNYVKTYDEPRQRGKVLIDLSRTDRDRHAIIMGNPTYLERFMKDGYLANPPNITDINGTPLRKTVLGPSGHKELKMYEIKPMMTAIVTVRFHWTHRGDGKCSMKLSFQSAILMPKRTDTQFTVEPPKQLTLPNDCGLDMDEDNFQLRLPAPDASGAPSQLLLNGPTGPTDVSRVD